MIDGHLKHLGHRVPPKAADEHPSSIYTYLAIFISMSNLLHRINRVTDGRISLESNSDRLTHVPQDRHEIYPHHRIFDWNRTIQLPSTLIRSHRIIRFPTYHI